MSRYEVTVWVVVFALIFLGFFIGAYDGPVLDDPGAPPTTQEAP